MENVLNLIKSLLYALFVYIGIDKDVAMILFVLMMIDSGLGIVKALRLGYKFSFRRLAWGIVIKLTLLVVPMIVALVGKGLGMDFKLFVVAIINILIVNEGISCVTNILSAKTKKVIENTDFVTKLLELIRKAFTALIQRLLGALDKESKNLN